MSARGGAVAGNLQKSPIFSVTIAQPLEKVKLAALTVLDLAGNWLFLPNPSKRSNWPLQLCWTWQETCPRCGAPAPQIHGRGAGGVAGGAGNDASCGVAGKGGAGSLRPLGCSQFSMSKRAVLTLVPWLAKVPAGRSSYHPPEFSARGFKVVCCLGPFAQMATKRPPGFSIFIA